MSLYDRLTKQLDEAEVDEIFMRDDEVEEKTTELYHEFEDEFKELLNKYRKSYIELLGENAAAVEFEDATNDIFGRKYFIK